VKVGLAAAGTGGHIFPALAVASELVSRGASKDDIVFFGGDRMEASVIPEAGYPFVAVDIHGIRRSLSLDNVTLPLKVRRARDAISSEIDRLGLRVMVVFGGYVSGPAALAASRAGIPLVIHEANAVPGVANRLIARRADTIYAAFAPSLERLPGATVIGSPLRTDFVEFDREALRAPARDRFGLEPGAVVLAVFGGSQGASFLNEVASILGTDPERSFQILHVTGASHHDDVAQAAIRTEGWVTVPFESSMADVYAAADVVLTRGGAMTISEIEATRTPAIVVPLPAGRAYQGRNASGLEASGGGIVVPQTDAAEVAATVRSLMDDPSRIAAMASARPSVDHRRAASVMADRIEELGHA
jgi:UDP-N-acetylglucosamine--N-acetylmuramyl-(pentapeptide) pyrophosphoryl-undecaprenol N-acetylglucosamine transferase